MELAFPLQKSRVPRNGISFSPPKTRHAASLHMKTSVRVSRMSYICFSHSNNAARRVPTLEKPLYVCSVCLKKTYVCPVCLKNLRSSVQYVLNKNRSCVPYVLNKNVRLFIRGSRHAVLVRATATRQFVRIGRAGCRRSRCL